MFQYRLFFIFLTISLVLFLIKANGQDSVFIKVHFLYGSKPHKAYKSSEPKWFGGILGGHVGIESDSNKVLNFVPHGKFHLIPNNIAATQ